MPHLIKTMCEKTRENIVLNSENLKAFALRLGIRQGYPFSLFLFNTVLKILEVATD